MDVTVSARSGPRRRGRRGPRWPRSPRWPGARTWRGAGAGRGRGARLARRRTHRSALRTWAAPRQRTPRMFYDGI